MQAIFETLFDVVYLTTVITLGILMITRSVKAHGDSHEAAGDELSHGSRQYLLFGIMAVTLGGGGLIPPCTEGAGTLHHRS